MFPRRCFCGKNHCNRQSKRRGWKNHDLRQSDRRPAGAGAGGRHAFLSMIRRRCGKRLAGTRSQHAPCSSAMLVSRKYAAEAAGGLGGPSITAARRAFPFFHVAGQYAAGRSQPTHQGRRVTPSMRRQGIAALPQAAIPAARSGAPTSEKANRPADSLQRTRRMPGTPGQSGPLAHQVRAAAS